LIFSAETVPSTAARSRINLKLDILRKKKLCSAN